MDPRDAKTGTLVTDTDVMLMRLVQRGDEHALAMLYQNHSALIYSLALSVVRNKADAEEVTVDVFTKIWQKAKMFDSRRGSVLAWMVTLTRRLAIDRTRSKHFKAAAKGVDIDGVADEQLGSASVTVATDRVTQNLQAEEVMNALQQLESRYREVIELSYFEGLSHAKIANHLDTPLGTVKSRLRDGLKQLRKILDVSA